MVRIAAITASLLFLVAGTSEPAIYSCNVEGRAVYSDRPCSTNDRNMSVIELPEKPPSQPGEVEESVFYQEKRDLIRLRFNHEILESDISRKEKEIDDTAESMNKLKQIYDERVGRLHDQLNRYNRSQTYGKLQEQRILTEIESLQIEFRNKSFIARDRIKSLRTELILLKQKKNNLEARIQEKSRKNR